MSGQVDYRRNMTLVSELRVEAGKMQEVANELNDAADALESIEIIESAKATLAEARRRIKEEAAR